MKARRIRDYEIVKTLGRGGMGTVYLGRHVHLDTLAALKVLLEEYSSEDALKQRFVNEARIIAGMAHPNIVDQKEFFEEDGRLVLVMEYVEGTGLDGMIGREVGPIPHEKALPIFRQVLEAVSYAHSKGVVHRDIKPSNVLVSSSGAVKVTDFGIAKIAGQKGLTRTGAQMGTLYYESPEQVQGAGDADHRSDIYSLGMTLYEMLAGRLPFEGGSDTSEFKVMNAIVYRDDHLDPREYYPHIPEWLVTVVQKATHLDPDSRFQSCEQFLSAVESEASQKDVESISPPPEAERQRQASRSAGSGRKKSSIGRIAGIAAGSVAVAVLALALGGVFGGGQPEPDGATRGSTTGTGSTAEERTVSDKTEGASRPAFDYVNTIRPEVVTEVGGIGRRRLLHDSDLEDLSYREIKLVRNYFYASYNRPFSTAWIREYFEENMPGYTGRGPSNPQLTDVERENVDRIVRYEDENDIPVINY